MTKITSIKISLQAIEDYYYRKGLRGSKLRQATEKDKEYMKILQERWAQLKKNIKIKPADKKKYNLSAEQDYQILDKIYQLEKKKLTKNDKVLIKLIRTQLEHHWRTPIIKYLDNLLKKYC